jgi:predicted enzyme related to lactoylglutathione lyase
VAEPFRALRFLYLGSAKDKFPEDVRYYREVLGADEIWNAEAFGARVAAFKLSEAGPQVLLADHRPAGSCVPVYEVEDLDKAVKALKKRGWRAEAGPFGIPNGDCYTFRDPSGNEFAVFEDMRPGAMEGGHGETEDASD